MRKTYRWQLKVRTYETNRFGMVNNAVYLNYLEETATQASADAGYPMQWYLENHCMWLIRKMTIRFDRPAFYGDELELETWVSDLQRVRSHRDYRIRRGQEQIARARANWVFMDTQTMRPRRVVSNFVEAFGLHEEVPEPIPVRLKNPQEVTNPRIFMSEHTAKSYEIDMVGHVNNSMYPRWTEHGALAILRDLGWTFERQQAEFNAMFMMVGREIEYAQAALEGDKIQIRSYLAEYNRTRAAMVHEIRNAATDELLVQDYSVGVMVNPATLRPIPLPEKMLIGFME